AAKSERPPVTPVFFAFRTMVGMWLIMFGMTLWSWVLMRRGKLYTSRAFLRVAVWTLPVGYIAVTAGWITTEVGRQPWVVYRHLRTAEAVTPSLSGADVMASLVLYSLVYAVIFGAGVYYLRRLVQRGLPDDLPALRLDRRPARPLSAATSEE
ncbi:MAG: cytochrome ubiquinol oxidase subunit I, partial [Burkholderiales bacterium]